jgi:hypothetical protein
MTLMIEMRNAVIERFGEAARRDGSVGKTKSNGTAGSG